MRELINITTYPTPHNSGNGGGGGKTYITYNGNTGINNSSANSGRMNFNSVNGGEGTFTYILAKEGTIVKLEGDELNYNTGFIGELESDKITTGQLKADDAEIVKAWIETLDSKKITTEYLTVTKQAHFFELIIDKVRAVGGQIILTPAQCVADVVIARDSNGNAVNLYKEDGTLVNNISTVLNSVAYFDVYFRNEDEMGHGIANEWLEHDQAFCQSFNVTEGVHHNIANKYYWRHVDAVLPDKMVNFETSELRDIGNSLTATNNIHISMSPTSKGGYNNGIEWQAEAQNIQGIQSTVQWNDIYSASNAINGIMKTDSTLLGIQIKPTSANKYYPTDTLQFQMYYTDNSNNNYGAPEGMKIGVYYKDGTSEYFTNLVYDGNNIITLKLNANTEIEAIVIVCTQPVQWHQCHCIRLSNTNMDEMLSPQASIPESGDNIVQLGYQGEDANSEVDGYSRQSAIIIAAYRTPDHELTAPSYAQYMGINDYHLSSHRGSYIDGKGAEFLGDIRLAKVAVDDEGNPINMSEFVLDEKQIKATVSELIITENNHYTENKTLITQNANAISLEAQRRVDGDTVLQSAITVQADRITSEVRDRQNADQALSSSITQTATQIRSWVGEQDYATNSSVSSQITQQADRITAEVQARKNADRDLRSSITQTADAISAEVRDRQNADNALSSRIDVLPGQISLQVTQDIEGKLTKTGIDIENKTINLKANTINVTPSTGGNDEIAFSIGNRNSYPHTLQTRRRISIWNANMNQYAILGAGSEGGFMKVGDYYNSRYAEVQTLIDTGKPTIRLQDKAGHYLTMYVGTDGFFHIKFNNATPARLFPDWDHASNGEIWVDDNSHLCMCYK